MGFNSGFKGLILQADIRTDAQTGKLPVVSFH